MAVKQARYQTIRKEDAIEIRDYEPMTIAISSESDIRGMEGFNELFQYISGNNMDRQKISMTAPVLNTLGEAHLTTAFVMPDDIGVTVFPKPLHPGIQLKNISKRRVAAIIFSGSISRDIIDQNQKKLSDWLRKEKLNTYGSYELARYNPPFIPGFLKRNELLVEIRK